MGTRLTSTIKLDGPFFQRDPRKTFRQNVRRMMQAVADEGARDVIQRLRAGESRRARIRATGDRVADHVVGRVRSLTGHPWAVSAVVSVSSRGLGVREAVSTLAAGSRVESEEHPFRRMTSQMRKARAVNADELMKGIS